MNLHDHFPQFANVPCIAYWGIFPYPIVQTMCILFVWKIVNRWWFIVVSYLNIPFCCWKYENRNSRDNKRIHSFNFFLFKIYCLMESVLMSFVRETMLIRNGKFFLLLSLLLISANLGGMCFWHGASLRSALLSCQNIKTFPQCWKRAYVRPKKLMVTPKKIDSHSDPSKYISPYISYLYSDKNLKPFSAIIFWTNELDGFRRSRTIGYILSYLTDVQFSTFRNHEESCMVVLNIFKGFDCSLSSYP